MQFEYPELAWATLAVASAVGIMVARGMYMSDRAGRYLQAAGPRKGISLSRKMPVVAVLVRFLGLCILLLAAAGPRIQNAQSLQSRRHADVVFLLDVSASMWADDVEPSRMEAARNAVLVLERLLPQDRVALVCCGGGSYVSCPLTSDHGTFLSRLDAASPSLFVFQGSAIRAGLAAAQGVAARGARQRNGSGAIIILLSDGEFHGLKPVDLLRKAEMRDIAVHAVALGTEAGTILRVQTAGGTEVKTDDAGEPVLTKCNMASLRSITQATGGKLWRYAGNMPERREDIVAGHEWTAHEEQSGFSLARFAVLAAFTLVSFSFVLPRLSGSGK